MPNLGFGEILLILILALVVFGPRKLPEMGRSVGKSLREFRRAASDLRAEIENDDAEPPRVPSPAARKEREAKTDPSPDDAERPPAGELPPD